MKYLHEIIWYLALPATVLIAYYAVMWGIKKFHKTLETEESEEVN